jgi:1-acyl-sn-glycerol-3-phosphate acyltransferase
VPTSKTYKIETYESKANSIKFAIRILRQKFKNKAKLSGFILDRPTYPVSIVQPDVESKLGVNYDTSWSRKPLVRAVRSIVRESVARPFFAAVAAPQVIGLESLTLNNPPYIFTANHASHLDTGLLLTTLPYEIRRNTVAAAAADYFFDTRFKAILAAGILNAIPLERTKVNRSSAKLAQDLVEMGWNLVIFPEGGRTPDGWGQPFKGGAAYLSIRTGVPIVPVYIHNTRALLKKGSKKLTTGATKVVFGNPIYADEKEDARKYAVRIENEVASLKNEIGKDYYSSILNKHSATTPLLQSDIKSKWLRSWLSEEANSSNKKEVLKWPKL